MNLEQLNPKQRAAVLHDKGPLLILAGAGSGKTRTLTYRVAHLIDKGISPYRILVMTFTNKAANEMKQRINELIGERFPFMWIGTFHSICLRILRQEAVHLGYKIPFTIYSRGNQNTLVKRCLKELNIDNKKYEPKAVLAAINRAKNRTQLPKDLSSKHGTSFDRVVADVYGLYQKRLQEHNAMDFGDLIMNVVLLFKKHPAVLNQYQSRFDHVLLDEYQDTNNAQYQLVRLLTEKNRNVCVVGDDDQSIYGWRGADLSNILEFEHDFPEALTIRLEQNYRSTGNILSAANAVILNNSFRKQKELWTDKGDGELIQVYQANDADDEALFVLKKIIELNNSEGYKWNEFAILYRTHAQSRAVEDIFVNHNMPYKIYGGLRFYDRKEIQDILAYANLLINPNDDTRFTRVVNTPKRGIGAKSLTQLAQYANEQGLSLYNAAVQVDKIVGLTARAKTKFKNFVAIIAELTAMLPFFAVNEIIKEVKIKSGYQQYLDELKQKNSVDAETRLENISELETVATKFLKLNPDLGLKEFLGNIALEADVDNYQEEDESVTLMTLHAAKGLEFRVVFLIGLEDGLFPHSRALFEEEEMEEERRLCYVGVTRARDRLFLSHAFCRRQYGETKYNLPSRFLSEIPDDSIEKVNDFSNKFRPDLARKQRSYSPGRLPVGLTIGDRVVHEKFGLGRVIARDQYLVTVDFAENGMRSLDPKSGELAKLTGRKNVNTINSDKSVGFQESSVNKFEPGDAVEHSKFGYGLVEEHNGDLVTISFKKVGRKKLSLAFASLRKVEKGE